MITGGKRSRQRAGALMEAVVFEQGRHWYTMQEQGCVMCSTPSTLNPCPHRPFPAHSLPSQ